MKPTFVGVAALFLSGCLVFHVNAQTKRATAETFHSIGVQLYDAGKYGLAADTLEAAVRLFDEASDLGGKIKSQLMLGECFANMGHCDRAIDLIQAALDLARTNYREDQPEIGDSYYYLARAKGGCARKWDEAISLMRISISLRRKMYGDQSPEVALNYNFLGYMLNNIGQHDSAIVYLDRALSIRREKSAPDDIELSHVLFNIAIAYEKKGALSKSLELHLESLRIRQARLGDEHPSVSNSITSIGGVYQRFGNYDRALDYYQKGLETRIRTLGPDHNNVAASYYTIGNLYGSMFNYHQSLQYFQQGNRIMSKNYGGANDVLATYLAYTGRLYAKIGDHPSAVQYINDGQVMAEKLLKKDHPYLAIVYNIAGDYYSDLKDLSNANRYYSKAISIYQKAYGPGSVREGDVYSKLGQTYAALSDHEKALATYNQALAIFDAKMGTRNVKSASTHHAAGITLTSQKRYADALESFRKAFKGISSDPDYLADPNLNPALPDLENEILALRISASKADAFYRWGVGPDDDRLAKLGMAMESYDYSMKLIERISGEYNNENGRAELEKQSRAVYNRGLNTAYDLYVLTGNRTYAEKAFSISARSKSALLLENMKDERAKMLAGVPDSLVSAERDLKIELAYHKNNLYQAQKTRDSARIAANEQQIFDVDQRIQQLKRELERNFASYYRHKYERSSVTVAEVRAFVDDPAAAVIEYFVGDTVIYRFAVVGDNFHFDAIPKKDELLLLVADYEKSLSDGAFIMNARDSADRMYLHSAHAIYELLLEDIVDQYDDVTRMIIVPDDFLAQLNFGTLLSRGGDEANVDYLSLDFLARRFQVSYVYSSYFLRENRVAKKKFDDLFAGFAPSYRAGAYADVDTVSHPLVYFAVRDGILPLPGAQDEVKRISDLMGGRTWLDLDATETNFKTHAGDYGILHLAMHSLLNNENPSYSELLFNPEMDQMNDGYLNIAEIYNLKLNAQLVVLSACSSGYGKIQKGEGPISISRAFSYAGCPSVVMSLWKIPDSVTSEIMANFYLGLNNGLPKDEALRQAQLKFLGEVEDPLYRHPYFWAGFVVMGDTTPLPSVTFSWLIYGTLLGLSVLAAVLFVRKRRKNQYTAS